MRPFRPFRSKSSGDACVKWRCANLIRSGVASLYEPTEPSQFPARFDKYWRAEPATPIASPTPSTA
jgi:hypothetical protein